MAGNTSKDFMPFINGSSFPNLLADFEIPERKRKTDTYHAGGMLAEAKVNMGEEPKQGKLTWVDLPEYLLGQYGVCENNAVRLRIVSSEEGLTNCAHSKREYIMVGAWDNIKKEKIELGKITKATVEIEIEEYQEFLDGVEVEYWHKQMGVHRVWGNDLTATRRATLEKPY